MNRLYLGDCLNVLRENIPTESVDLIYIDPPFNSKRDYNMFFDNKDIQTQRVAFEDTWTLKNINESLSELHSMQTEKIYQLLQTYHDVAPHAFPYLVMMAIRIVELRRVLKSTGSFYLHCDPTMSHYLKTVCDVAFGVQYFQSEIIWKRKSGRGASNSQSKNFGQQNDTILMYSKGDDSVFNNEHSLGNAKDYIEERFVYSDERGRRYMRSPINSPSMRENLKYEYKGHLPPDKGWAVSRAVMERMDAEGRLYFPPNKNQKIYRKIFLDEYKGQPVQNLWTDIPFINPMALERLGYPTQKPKALLERIIKASSNEDDVVLDAFCGCGTTIDAAEGLHRQWIGIDVSPVAIALMKKRMENSYKGSLSKFEVRGIPEDEQSAMRLWQENPFAFQDWWITEFSAFSTTLGTKGADKGIDGIAKYLVGSNGETAHAAFQVKGGVNVQSKDIDALIGAMSKHKCELGVFLTSAEPTKPMLETVAGQGFVDCGGTQYPKLQILTLKEYFTNKQLKLPLQNITFSSAKFSGKKAKQYEIEE